MKSAESYSRISKKLQVGALAIAIVVYGVVSYQKAHAHVDLLEPTVFIEREWQRYKDLEKDDGALNEALDHYGIERDRDDDKESSCTTSRD